MKKPFAISTVDLAWMAVVGFVAGACSCAVLWAGTVIERVTPVTPLHERGAE